jgi:hypothetical protein
MAQLPAAAEMEVRARRTRATQDRAASSMVAPVGTPRALAAARPGAAASVAAQRVRAGREVEPESPVRARAARDKVAARE